MNFLHFSNFLLGEKYGSLNVKRMRLNSPAGFLTFYRVSTVAWHAVASVDLFFRLKESYDEVVKKNQELESTILKLVSELFLV